MKRIFQENTPRVIGLALVLATGGLAMAAIEGTFAKFSSGELLALALFAAAFATLTYRLDARVRAAVKGWFGLAGRRSAPASAKGLGGDLA